ncbi:hypothetical protein AAZX31_10G060200 [Glycine max]|nr:hypothetical protein GmHk_10G027946 [Glycine max]
MASIVSRHSSTMSKILCYFFLETNKQNHRRIIFFRNSPYYGIELNNAANLPLPPEAPVALPLLCTVPLSAASVGNTHWVRVIFVREQNLVSARATFVGGFHERRARLDGQCSLLVRLQRVPQETQWKREIGCNTWSSSMAEMTSWNSISSELDMKHARYFYKRN